MESWRRIFSSEFKDEFKPYKILNKTNFPTRSKFTGDKFPKSGDAAKAELNDWHRENSVFKGFKEKEDKDDFTSLVVNENGRVERIGDIGNLYPINKQSWQVEKRKVTYDPGAERGWGFQKQNKAHIGMIVKVKDKYYELIQPIKASQLIAGRIYGMSFYAFNSGVNIYQFHGFTDLDDKYGEQNNIKFKSAKELLDTYSVRSWGELEKKQEEIAKEKYAREAYGHQSYMSVTDLETGKSGAWFYLFHGKWCVGSGAEKLTFWEVEEVEPTNINSSISWRNLFKVSEISFQQKSDGTVSIDVTTPETPLLKADEEAKEMKEETFQPNQSQKVIQKKTFQYSQLKDVKSNKWRNLFKFSEVSFNQKPDGTVTIDVTNPPISEPQSIQTPEFQKAEDSKENKGLNGKPIKQSFLRKALREIKGIKGRKKINKLSLQEFKGSLSLDDLNVGDKVRVKKEKVNNLLETPDFLQNVHTKMLNDYYENNSGVSSLKDLVITVLSNEYGEVLRKEYTDNKVLIKFSGNYGEFNISLPVLLLEIVSDKAENSNINNFDNERNKPESTVTESSTKQWVIKSNKDYSLIGRECKDRCGIFIIKNNLIKNASLSNTLSENAIQKEIQIKNNHTFREVINQGYWETKFDDFVSSRKP